MMFVGGYMFEKAGGYLGRGESAGSVGRDVVSCTIMTVGYFLIISSELSSAPVFVCIDVFIARKLDDGGIIDRLIIVKLLDLT